MAVRLTAKVLSGRKDLPNTVLSRRKDLTLTIIRDCTQRQTLLNVHIQDGRSGQLHRNDTAISVFRRNREQNNGCRRVPGVNFGDAV